MTLGDAVKLVLDKGHQMAPLARELGITEGKMRRAVAKERAARDAAGVPDDQVRITGGFTKPDAGDFTWDNIDSVPTDAQIRQIIALTGADPDDFEWWVTRIDFAQNDTAWKRDQDTATELAGVKGTAYTGTAKRGRVSIHVQRRSAADLEALRNLPRIEVKGPRYRCTTCHKRFDRSRVGTLWCSARCRDDAPYERDGEVMRHIVIPDTQVKPGVPTDHLYWAGRYIREQCAGQRTRIIHLGDHWDMAALSSYDRGKKAAENRRVRHDIEAGNRALEVLDEAMGDDPLWDRHFLLGNHEERIERYVNEHPELEGFLSYDNLITPAGWERHGFLEPVELDGVVYAHYFYQPNTGRPYSGENIEARLKQIGHSFVMGHQQGLRMGMHYAAGRQRVGVVAGSFYQHDEGYKGPQGNHHWRGIVVLNEVEDGGFDPMPVSLDYLCRRYEGHRIADHEGVVL